MGVRTWKERRAVREQILAELQATAPTERRAKLPQLSKRHGLDTEYIRAIAKNNGIQWPRADYQTGSASTYGIIAQLLLGNTQQAIAEKFGLTRQRVQQIAGAMEKNGVFKAAKASRNNP